MSPYREQPLELVHAPPHYRSHNYTGPGVWARIRSGVRADAAPVGTLSWSLTDPGTLNWFSTLAPSSPYAVVRYVVEDMITGGARRGVAPATTRESILDAMPHEPVKEGDLATLRDALTS